MRRVRQNEKKGQLEVPAIPLDDGTLITAGDAEGNGGTLAMIQALIPLGLRAVEEALQKEVTALAGSRYARGDGHPDVVRWGSQPGSIYLADQKLPITVPRVRDMASARQHEIPLATYAQLQAPRAQDVGLFRCVLGGISCREYVRAAEAPMIRSDTCSINTEDRYSERSISYWE